MATLSGRTPDRRKLPTGLCADGGGRSSAAPNAQPESAGQSLTASSVARYEARIIPGGSAAMSGMTSALLAWTRKRRGRPIPAARSGRDDGTQSPDNATRNVNPLSGCGS